MTTNTVENAPLGLSPVKIRKFPRNYTDRDIVAAVIKGRPSREEPLYIVNLSKVAQQIQYFRDLLPRIQPFYAVKCNPNKRIIEKLHQMGVSYDCASMGEMKLVEKVIGLTEENRAEYFSRNVVFANPCKQISHIKYAKEIGVRWVVVDGINEMKKMAKYYPEADLVIRIKTDDSTSKCQFSVKFGATLDECPRMLRYAQENNLKIVGVSFHIGSGCGNAKAYIGALTNARTLFDMALECGFKMDLLDIGGGMPGTENGLVSFKDIAETIRDPIDEMFDQSVRVIAEPGRFVATQSHMLLCNVFSKKEKPEDPKFVYYCNESIYGGFGCVLFDHATPKIEIFGKEDEDLPTYSSTIFGATCDSIDLIFDRVYLPEMDEGQWLYFTDFGAYTTATATYFNGIKTKNFIYCEFE